MRTLLPPPSVHPPIPPAHPPAYPLTLFPTRGRFGRGAAGNDLQETYKALNAQYLSRPARVQLVVDFKAKGRLEGANDFNIWYGRYMGEHWNPGPGSGELQRGSCVLRVSGGRVSGA